MHTHILRHLLICSLQPEVAQINILEIYKVKRETLSCFTILLLYNLNEAIKSFAKEQSFELAVILSVIRVVSNSTSSRKINVREHKCRQM